MQGPTVVNYSDDKYLRDPRPIRVSCPPLTLSEWQVLCDTLNGSMRTDDIAPFLCNEVSDSNQEDYELDLNEFAGRLKKFPDLQSLAILHTVDNFWKLSGQKMGIEKTLREAGANIKSE